jgi:hypothetical protein
VQATEGPASGLAFPEEECINALEIECTGSSREEAKISRSLGVPDDLVEADCAQ